MAPPTIAYVASMLPSLSETFVYNELFAVRSLGLDVVPVSVYAPSMASTGGEVGRLAAESLVAYSPAGVRAALAELVRSPIRSLRTLTTAIVDAVTARDTPIRTRVKILVQALASLGVAARLRPRAVGHLHAHMANTPATVAMYAARHLGVPFSFTGHANDLFVHRVLLPQKLDRCSFVACISRWHRDFYRRWSSVDDQRAPVVRCGVDTASHTAAPSAHTPASSPGQLQILSVGRLVAKKGMDTLIRAVAQLGTATPVECRIVGDGPERARLEELLLAAGSPANITLMGACPNAQVLNLINDCDVFVLACRRDPVTGDQDGIPVSLMEAMAARRCVVTSNLAPLDELVIPDQTGVCVPPDDPAALADALRRLAEDPARRDRLAQAGRRHVELDFDRAVNANRLVERFAPALARPSHTPA